MATLLKPVTRDDVGPLIRLNVRDDQDGFVAPNSVTLAQVAYEPNAEVFVIWSEDSRVGLAAVIDLRDYPFIEEGDDPDAAFLWRLMIGADHQGQGHGKAALDHVADWARGRRIPALYTSAVQTNDAALAFYESAGFERTGRLVDNEVELRRSL